MPKNSTLNRERKQNLKANHPHVYSCAHIYTNAKHIELVGIVEGGAIRNKKETKPNPHRTSKNPNDEMRGPWLGNTEPALNLGAR